MQAGRGLVSRKAWQHLFTRHFIESELARLIVVALEIEVTEDIYDGLVRLPRWPVQAQAQVASYATFIGHPFKWHTYALSKAVFSVIVFIFFMSQVIYFSLFCCDS